MARALEVSEFVFNEPMQMADGPIAGPIDRMEERP